MESTLSANAFFNLLMDIILINNYNCRFSLPKVFMLSNFECGFGLY